MEKAWNKKNIIVVIALLCLSFIIRIIFLINTDNGWGGDAPGRILYALSWKENPRLIFDLNFGPLHFYLMGLILFIWNSPLIAPRVISLIFGALTIIPFYYFIRLVFDAETALYSGIVFCLYAFQVKFSVLTTAEATFHFCLFTSLFFLFRFKIRKEGRRITDLFLSSIFLNLASMLRFEGWIFVPLFIFVLLGERKELVIPFSLLSSIFPLFWMYTCFRVTGDPFIFATTATRETRFGINETYSISERLWGWPLILCKTLSIPVALLGFIGSIYGLFRKKYFYPAFIFLIVLLMFTYRTVQGNLALCLERYSLSPGLLLIPYAMLTLKMILDRLNKKWKYALLILLTGLMVRFCITQLLSYIPTSLPEAQGMMVPSYVKSVAFWLRDNVPVGEKVIFDQDEALNPNVILYSRLKPGQFVYVPMKFEGHSKTVDIEQLITDFMTERPKYMVIFYKGVLGDYIDEISNTIKLGEMELKFERFYQSDKYKVYRLSNYFNFR